MHQQINPVGSAPQQQAMLDSNQLRPMLVPKSNGAAGTLLYTSYPHKDINKWFTLRTLCCNWFECGCCSGVQRELRSSAYVKVFDNKVEWNEPANQCMGYKEKGCCFLCNNCNLCNFACHQFDDVNVLHYDRAITHNALPALGCCRPCGTHCDLCPNGCPGCYHGESVVLHATTPGLCWGCFDMSPWCSCCQVKYIHQHSNVGGAACGLAAFGTPCCPPYRIIKAVDNATQLSNAINNARFATGIQPIVVGKQDFNRAA
jgi:hypothetical protein